MKKKVINYLRIFGSNKCHFPIRSLFIQHSFQSFWIVLYIVLVTLLLLKQMENPVVNIRSSFASYRYLPKSCQIWNNALKWSLIEFILWKNKDYWLSFLLLVSVCLFFNFFFVFCYYSEVFQVIAYSFKFSTLTVTWLICVSFKNVSQSLKSACVKWCHENLYVCL